VARLLLIAVFSIGLKAYAQMPDPIFIDSVSKKIEGLLPTNWLIIKHDSGFSVFYCRSCIEYANKEIIKVENYYSTPKSLALSYFMQKGPDSVSFYSGLNLAYKYDPKGMLPLTESERKADREKYKPDGILKLDIVFSKKWSAGHLDTTRIHNELLRKKIMEQALGKNSVEFESLRYWVPKNYWKEKTREYSFFFERLPYESSWYNYSIFMIPRIGFLGCEIMYCEKNDPEYYYKMENHITREYHSVEGIISYALGIKDFNRN
jgi:hypothetical protein